MTQEDLETIEEAYDTRIGPDATTVRRLIEAVRAMRDELDAIDFALSGGYVPPEQVRAAAVAELVERCAR